MEERNMGSNEEDKESGTSEGLFGLLGDVAAEAVGDIPFVGTAIHGAQGLYHAHEMDSLNDEANATQDPNEAQALRNKAIAEGHEVEQNAVEAIPLIGAGFGIGSTLYNLTNTDPSQPSAAEKIWGDPTTTGPGPKVDAHGNYVDPQVCQ
jgi:hypothetical protein